MPVVNGKWVLDENGLDLDKALADSLAIPVTLRDSSANSLYAFDTDITSTDPTTGKVKANNVDISLSTEMYISSISRAGLALDEAFKLIKQTDLLLIRKFGEQNVYVLARINADLTDNTGWWTFPIEVLESNGSVAIGEDMEFLSIPAPFEDSHLLPLDGSKEMTGNLIQRAAAGQGIASVLMGDAGGMMFYQNASGSVYLSQLSPSSFGEGNWMAFARNGGVDINHNGSLRLRTTASGAKVTGQMRVTESVPINNADLTRKDWVEAHILRLENAANEVGVVKVNYTGLSLVNFTANVAQTFDIDAAVGTVVPSVTNYPRSTVGTGEAAIFDATRTLDNPAGIVGKLIENPVNKQENTWRVQVEFSGKAANSTGGVYLSLTNPETGFVNTVLATLPASSTDGVITTSMSTIADTGSTGSDSGYVLQITSTVTRAALAFNIKDITRFNYASQTSADLG